MDIIKGLQEAHTNADRLEKELSKCRGELIAAYENRNSNDLYTLKISYDSFDAVYGKETAKFNELLNKLDERDFIDNDTNSEITENTESASVLNVPSEKELLNEYSNKDIAEAQIESEAENGTNDSKNSETETETQTDIHFTELYNESTVVCEAQLQEITEEKSIVIPADIIVKSEKDFPVLNESIRPRAVPTKAPKYGSRIAKVNSGYTYKGNGFTVFTGYRNRCKPIYSSTTLFCRETRNSRAIFINEEKTELEDYLVKFGKFKKEMIEGIFFKRRGYNDRYALIKVRGPLSYIKKKIKTLNKAKGKIISVFRRSNTVSAKDFPNEILYVNNFDILKKDAHKKFTKLFMKYGELVKDIRMGLDSHRDPFAIVHFRDLSDASRCVASEMQFGNKVLSVKFSSF